MSLSKGWAYNTSKSAVVTASRCISGDAEKKQNNFKMVRMKLFSNLIFRKKNSKVFEQKFAENRL